MMLQVKAQSCYDKGGLFEVPKRWDRKNLPYHIVRGIAERHKPKEGADFYLPIFDGGNLIGIQYHRECNGN